MEQSGEPSNWALYGDTGAIGSELKRQVAQKHVAERFSLNRFPEYVVRSSGVFSSDGKEQLADHPSELPIPDVSFISIPTTDDGRIAYDYMAPILAAHKLVVTAEKGALANFRPELRALSSDFAYLGRNAAVGGGTRMLEVAEVYGHDPENINQVHVALSGTMTYMMHLLTKGWSLEKAAKKVIKKRLAEPGNYDPFAIVNGEAGDIAKKSFLLLSELNLIPDLKSWRNCSFRLNESDEERLREEGSYRRAILSFYNRELTDATAEDDIISGFREEHEDRLAVAGYRDIRHKSLFRKRLGKLKGPANGLVIGLGPDDAKGNPSDAIIELKGPGAGPRPTVNTMLDDVKAHRKKLYGTD